MLPMHLLLLGPIGLTVVILAAFLPYGSFRVAARNGTLGKQRRGRHIRREMRHLRRFLRSAVLLPFLIVVIMQGALFSVHHFVIPDTTMSDIFGEYHPEVSLNAPDLESWQAAIERSRQVREFEAQQRAEGFGPAYKETLTAKIVEHWPLHLVFVLFPLAFIAWFMTRPFLDMSQRYHYEVMRRAQRYAVHSEAAGAKALAKRIDYASPPGMLNENFG